MRLLGAVGKTLWANGFITSDSLAPMLLRQFAPTNALHLCRLYTVSTSPLLGHHCSLQCTLLYTHCTLLHTHCTLLHTHSLSSACQIPAHLEGNGIFKLTDRNQKKDMNNLFLIFLSELDRFLGFGGIQKQRA